MVKMSEIPVIGLYFQSENGKRSETLEHGLFLQEPGRSLGNCLHFESMRGKKSPALSEEAIKTIRQYSRVELYNGPQRFFLDPQTNLITEYVKPICVIAKMIHNAHLINQIFSRTEQSKD